jgi:hypothetical protein
MLSQRAGFDERSAQVEAGERVEWPLKRCLGGRGQAFIVGVLPRLDLSSELSRIRRIEHRIKSFGGRTSLPEEITPSSRKHFVVVALESQPPFLRCTHLLKGLFRLLVSDDLRLVSTPTRRGIH